MFAQVQPYETPLTNSGQWLSNSWPRTTRNSKSLSMLPGEQRRRGIRRIAANIRAEKELLLTSSAIDVSKYNGVHSLRERMTRDPGRLEALADSLEVVADLPVDVGQVLEFWSRPNGLSIEKVSSAIGVIDLIFESRPAVGVEAAALTLKTANSLILRGGSDCWETLVAFQALVERSLEQCDLPTKCVQLVPSPDRAYVSAMLQGAGSLDLIIPRGGKSLVERVEAESRVPVLSHADGLNHTFVHMTSARASSTCRLAIFCAISANWPGNPARFQFGKEQVLGPAHQCGILIQNCGQRRPVALSQIQPCLECSVQFRCLPSRPIRPWSGRKPSAARDNRRNLFRQKLKHQPFETKTSNS